MGFKSLYVKSVTLEHKLREQILRKTASDIFIPLVLENHIQP